MLQIPRTGRARSAPRTDDGITLIEVVVAMFVFALIATGVLGGVNITLKMTPDNEARQVAANLAAQEIDLVRAIGDPYQVGSRTVHQTINGRVFTVDRETLWRAATGGVNVCQAATGTFELEVNVDVSWSDQAATTHDVRSDTLMAPSSTLTDGKTGAISVTVLDSANAPQPGVTVTITVATTNPNGAVAPSVQPPPTGTDGCTYLGKLTPGNYRVTISRSGNSTTYKQPVSVAAGATTPAVFQPFDGFGTLTRNDASNDDAQAVIPNDVLISYVTSGPTVKTSTAGSVSLPVGSAWSAVAGRFAATNGTTTCAEFDPAAWGAGLTNGGKRLANGERGAAVSPIVGSPRRIDVPMGTVTLRGVDGEWVKAVQATPAGYGNPGCATATTTVHFDQLSGDSAELALPYGTWTLFTGTTAALQATPVPKTAITATSNAVDGGVAADGTVTLDPRPLP